MCAYTITKASSERIAVIIIITFLIVVQCRNHSWVSFQGFCESYNDAFNLPRDLGEMNIIYIIVNGYICWIIVAMSVIQNLHLVLWLMLSTLESWKLSWDLLAMLTTVSRKIVTGSCVWRWSKKYDVPVHTLILLWNVHLIANREVLLLYNVQHMHAQCYGIWSLWFDCRLWEFMDYWWYMENCFPPLYVSCRG